MIGFQAAHDEGAHWLETDIQFSRDRHPMLYHDSTLNRTSQGEGHPWDHDASQLQEMGAGYASKFGRQVVGEPIPDGLVTIQGRRIVAVGVETPACRVRDLGNMAILPGLVNAHTHLEFSDFAAPPDIPVDFPAPLRYTAQPMGQQLRVRVKRKRRERRRKRKKEASKQAQAPKASS